MELRHRRVTGDETEGDESSFPTSTRTSRALRSLDLFPKAKEDFRRKQNLLGGVVSAMTISFISLLILADLLSFVFGWNAYRTELSVDRGVSSAVPFDIDISFPKVPCHELSLDAVDASGVQQDDLDHELLKTPIARGGDLIEVAAHRYIDRRFFEKHIRKEQEQQQQKNNNDAQKETDEKVLRFGKHNKNDPKYCGPCYVDPLTFAHAFAGQDDKQKQKEQKQWLTPEQQEAVRRHFEKPEHRDACCNTCDEVFAMYDKHKLPRPPLNMIEQCVLELSRQHPGCNVRGIIFLRKVQGAFFFAPGQGQSLGPFGEHVHVFSFDQLMRFDSSHEIRRFRIGDPNIERFSSRGQTTFALENHRYSTPPGMTSSIKYRLQIVPTAYRDLSKAKSKNGIPISFALGGGGTVASEELDELDVSYEYAVSESHRNSGGGLFVLFGGTTPSVLFKYDFFPTQLTHVFDRSPFSVFLVRACSMIGGLFVILGLVDRASQYLAKAVVWDKIVSKETAEKIGNWLRYEA